MRKIKRAALITSIGLCCMGLVLIGGEQFQIKGSDAAAKPSTDGTASQGLVYCPIYLYGQFNGEYYYSAYGLYQNMCGGPVIMTDYRLHTLGTSCSDCPDPISGAAHPLPAGESDLELTPKPDALFSGILR